MKKHPVRFGNKSRPANSRPGKNRRLTQQGFESLERRALLAGDTSMWQNPRNQFDVNGDGRVNASDALVLINDLNVRGMHILASSAPSSSLNASSQGGGASASANSASASSAPSNGFLDVNGDSIVSALDVLAVANAINQGTPNVEITLRATDLAGNPITEVVAGTDFKIEAYGADIRPQSPTGVFGAYFDITYDNTKITLEQNNPIIFSDFYTAGKQRDFSTAGVINETGSFSPNIGVIPGAGPKFLFAVTIHVNANATGSLDFGTNAADVAGNNILLYGENEPLNTANNEVSFLGTSVEIVANTGLPFVSITDVAKTELNSGSQQYVYTVSLSATSGQVVTVRYATQSDFATSTGTAESGGADFVNNSGTLTFNAGQTTQQITVVVNGDVTANEGNETFNVSLLEAINAHISDSRGLATITNDDPTPTISVNDPSAFESNSGTNTLRYTVTLSAPSQQQVTFIYATADGSATNGTDYTKLDLGQGGQPLTFTFAPGTTTGTIDVAINGDTTQEPNETVLLNLTNVAGATFAKATGTGTIVNDDGVQLPTLSIGDVSLTEGNSGTKPFVFPITLSSAAAAPVTVVVNTSNGTATTTNNDYQPITNQTFTIPAGATTASLTVLVTGNGTTEPDETFNVTLTSPIGASLLDGTAVGTIINDDGVVLPTISIGDVTLAEGNAATTNFVFPVTISSAAGAGTVTVVVNTAGVTANSPDDFSPVSGLTVTFTGATLTQNVTVSVIGDTATEPDESFNVNLSNAVGATISDATGVGTITNDDAAVSISIGDVTQTEGTGGTTNFVFNLSLSATSASPVTVQVATSNGTALSGSDYTALSQAVTFQAGVTTASVTVVVAGDALDEANETFNVNLSNAVGASISDATGLGTINDDDNAPTVSINDVSQVEGNTGTTNFVFNVTLSTASGQQILVPISVGGGNATAGTDYTTPAPSTLTFAAGETSKAFTVSVIGDTTQEQSETFNVNLSAPTNATLNDGLGVGTILDDDGPPSLSINSVSQSEGNTGTTNFVFTVTMAGTATENVTVVVGTSNGTATAGTDYATFTPATLTFTPGVTARQVTVNVAGDTFFEGNETFNVNLSNVAGGGATIATGGGVGVGTINNDDAQPSFSIDDVAKNEGNSGTTAFVFTVTKTGNSEQASTVVVNSSDVSASAAGGDYAALAPQTLTFLSGAQSTQSVTVLVNGDTSFESNETFNVTLSAPGNALIGDATGVGTITNDDGPPTLSIADVTQNEGNSGVTNFVFTVSLTGSATQPVTVVAASAVGSGVTPATPGTDYTALAAQTLTFNVGETSKTVTVQVTGDATSEADETFNVVLSSPTVATIGDGTAVGTITNDDGVPSITITDVTQNEGNSGSSNFIFTVSLSAASGQNVTVVAATANGSANSGSDYTALAAQTLTFTPGQTSKTVTVVVQGDTATEANETFNVNLTGATGATIAKTAGVGTITNDDGVPTVSITDATANEGNSGTTNLVFTVSLSGASSNPVTVNFATSAVTATAGNDFTSTSGVLTFAANETSKTITVQVTGDALNEANETFNVNLTSPTNASLGDGVGLGTITNDDPVPGLSINDVTLVEGNSGTTNFVFTVTLGAVSGQNVTVNFATADGTAVAGVNSGDYTAASGVLTFAPGETTKSITVGVRGDLFDEPNQSFSVNLTSPTNATLTDGIGTGTITNDDTGGGVEPANVSGFVYIDTNNGGSKDPNEKPISGVIIKLTGKNEANEDVSLQTTTDSTGAYRFVDIEPGTYAITETQPASYLDGTERPGSTTVTSTVSDTFTFSANGGENLVNNNFGERGLRPELISKRAALASSANVTNGTASALNVSANDLWMSYDAGWDGTLTAQASASGTGGNPTLALYDNSFNLLATGSGTDESRLDWNGTPGAPYFLRIGGGNTAVDLTVTNLVSQANGIVTVNGTAGDDNFEFVGGTNRFSINGVDYELNPANVSRLVFNGNGGNDTATLSGSNADDAATLGLGFGSLTSASYNVSVNNVATLAVNGGGGNDQATLQDSALADHLEAAGDWLSVSSAADLLTSLSGFESVRANASHGGNDTSAVEALDFVLERLGDWS